MAKIKVETLSVEELQGLVVEAQREIAQRTDQRQREVAAEIRALAKGVGMSVEEVLAQTPGPKGAGQVPVKYRNPDNPQETWSGRGRQPAWVREALAGGKTLEELGV